MNEPQACSRLGVVGLERLVEIKRPKGKVVLMPRVNVFLDLPHDFKVDEHAFQGAANRAVDEAAASELTSLEGFCSGIASSLLKKYPAAKTAEIAAEADYVVMRETPVSKLRSQEMYKLLGRAIGENGKLMKMIGVEIMGINSCPCAHEGLIEHARERLKENFSENEIEKILEAVPVASHNQRNTASILMEVPGGNEGEIEADDLIGILESAMSSPLYEVLKRDDEVAVVLKAHEEPNFVEDTVRKVLKSIVQKYRDLPDDIMVFVKSESQETIHQHNAIAERLARLRDIKESLRG